MTKTNNKPQETKTYLPLKAVIWANPSKDGTRTRYTVDYVKIYRTDDGQWKETKVFNESDNLKLAILSQQVASRIADIKHNEKRRADTTASS